MYSSYACCPGASPSAPSDRLITATRRAHDDSHARAPVLDTVGCFVVALCFVPSFRADRSQIRQDIAFPPSRPKTSPRYGRLYTLYFIRPRVSVARALCEEVQTILLFLSQAQPPYAITHVNQPWQEMCGYTLEVPPTMLAHGSGHSRDRISSWGWGRV